MPRPSQSNPYRLRRLSTALIATALKLMLSGAPRMAEAKPSYADFREGDVKHSNADISKARRLLGYEFTHDVSVGISETVDWYLSR